MRTTVDIQAPILDNARREAARLGLTVSQVVEVALRQYLVERKPRTRVKPFQLHTVHGVLVNPDMNLDRTSELLTEDDRAAYK